MSVAAHPDASVTIRPAEIFTQLMAFDVSARSNNGRIAVEADHHVSDVHGLVPELPAAAGRHGFTLGGDLAERGDGDIVLGEGAQRKFRVAAKAGFFSLALHVDNLTNGFLFSGIESRSGMKGDVLSAKCRCGREHAEQ